MSNSHDLTLWEKQSSEPERSIPYTSKQVLLHQDENTSYAGEIRFNMSCFSNNDLYMDWSEAYLQIPYVVKVTTAAASTKFDNETFSFKSGFFHIIDQISVSISNSNVYQNQSFTNMYANFHLLTCMDYAGLEKNGASIGFYPDTADTLLFGDGKWMNNKILKNTAADGYNTFKTNMNLVKRRDMTISKNTGPTGIPLTKDPEGLSSFQKVSDTEYYYVFIATIYLKDICPLFEKLGMQKNLNVRIDIKYNACSDRFYKDDAVLKHDYVQKSGSCNPIMACTQFVNIDDEGTITIESGVALRSANIPFSNCRIYIPAYTMNPIYEQNLISTNPISRVDYEEVNLYIVTVTNNIFTSLLSNGITDPKLLIVIPQYADTPEEYQSLYSSCPGTNAGWGSILNFQVKLAGVNVWQNQQEYSYQQFLDELSSYNAVNGNLERQITSGIINFHMFNTAYRYYICDLSRRLPSNNIVPLGVEISGKNNSVTTNLNLKLICFILSGKSIKIDRKTGEKLA